MPGSLAGATLSNKLMTPHRQLHIEDLRDRIMVPAIQETRGRTGAFVIKNIIFEGKREGSDIVSQAINSHHLHHS